MENIDWSALSFGYMPTDFNVRCSCKNGVWGDLEIHDTEYVSLHMAATCLHYGQEAFEGLKAFKGRDGKVRIFRMRENAERMQSSCDGIMMAKLPIEKFEQACLLAVERNLRFVPPYESGASLYIRPVLFGTSAQVGVSPSKDYLFIVFVTPVGPYFKNGFKPTPMCVMRGYDRAAAHGTGTYKVGGNYAASLQAGEEAHKRGYANIFYLDSVEKRYIDECGAANFFAIKGNSYVTPASTSVLPSITNKSLIQLATDMGMQIERRQVPIEELAEFSEAGACGTAAVITPIERIDDLDRDISYVFAKDGNPGPVSTRLYQQLRAIQYGDAPDPYGWITVVPQESL